MRSVFLLLVSTLGFSQQSTFQAPDDVEYRSANIISEGTRMHAEVFSAKVNAGKKLPTILMAHGWGGNANGLRRDAVEFAQAGYLVVSFDYRGWGESDSRVILTGPAPKAKDGKFTAEVREVREVVDPLDMVTDWFNVIHWVQAEPQFDPDRLGLWGSSFSGGLVVYVAERDHRVKAIHSQVGSLDGRGIMITPEAKALAYDEATKMARGQMPYPEPLAKVLGNLRGAPIRSRFMFYAPVDEVQMAGNCAMQFVIAGKEELFDNKDHALKAYALVKGPKNLVTIPNITHYGIYGEARVQTHKLAQEWFDKYLKR